MTNIDAVLDDRSVLIFQLTLPLLISLAAPLKRTSRILFYALAGIVALINLALILTRDYTARPVDLSQIFVFSFDRYSYLFLALVNVCWFITLVYSYSYVRHRFQEHAEQFHRYLAVALSVVLATGSSGNLFTMLLCYGLSALAVYPLLVSFVPEKSRVGAMYLTTMFVPLLTVVVPVCLWLGIMFVPFPELNIKSLGLTDFQAGALLAMFVVLLTKNCVAPFHYWLPRTSFAPAPVSALIHTVGAVQTGNIALIKLGYYAYGFEYLAQLNDKFWGTGWLTYLLGATAIYTAWQAWRTTNLKTRFSYSTVGQLAYIATAVLTGTKAAVLGAILHIVSHSFAKMTLFFNAGILGTLFKATETYEVARIAPRVPWIVFSTGLAGLSITGFPLLAGYYSKDLMLIEEVNRQHYAAAGFLLLGSVINFFYIFPILKAGFGPHFSALMKGQRLRFPEGRQKISRSMVLAVGMSSLLVLLFSKYVYLVIRIATP